MSRIHPLRRSTRWPARWPMLYGNEEFVAKGTVLHVTTGQWRVEGPMPVHPGMRLNFWVWPPERPKGLHVEGATVLWVKAFEFGVDVQNVDPANWEWLPTLPRRLELWPVSQAA